MTEREYFKGFASWCKNPLILVVIPDVAGDPIYVVRKAKQLKLDAEREASRERDENLTFDEVWCVVDVDNHERLKDARAMAAANNLHMAVSNPCFELWLLLHFRDSPGMQDRKAVQRMVRDFLPDYEKHLKFEELRDGYPQATARARRLDEDCEKMGEQGRNPSTGVYRITELIRSLGRGAGI